MRLRKAIKLFEFSEPHRSELTLGTHVRLDPVNHRLALKRSNGAYSTNADLFAKTRLTTPTALKKWFGFQAYYKNQSNFDNVVVTSVKFRLSTDGSNELFWDGADWVAASPGDWNTEDEVSANIQALSNATRSLQIVANLSTSDSKYTPELYWVKVIWEGDFDYQEDYTRSLLRKMKAELRPLTQFLLTATSSASVSFSKVEAPLDITSVDSMFDLTTDPNRLSNILLSYDLTAKTATASAPLTAGHQIEVRVIYRPVVTLDTDQDYVEVAKVPSVSIEALYLDTTYMMAKGDFVVVNKTTGEGWKLGEGFQSNIEVHIVMKTELASDLQRLGDEVKHFFDDRFITASATDEPFRLWLVEDFNQTPGDGQSGLRTARLRARIANAIFYPRDADPITAVRRLLVTGGNLNFEA